MNKELSIVVDRERNGICDVIFNKLNSISKSTNRYDFEFVGYHYYFYDIVSAYLGKDFKDKETGERILLIRKIGMSCGYIQIDENDIVVKSRFYEDEGNDKDMEKMLEQFHGCKVKLDTSKLEGGLDG